MAQYSDAIISPNLKTTRMLHVPQAVSMSECITACCKLPGCDLAWVFEGRCYIVNCQRKDECKPMKTSTVESYLTFVQKSLSQRLGSQAAHYKERGHSLGLSPEDESSLADLALYEDRNFEDTVQDSGPHLQSPPWPCSLLPLRPPNPLSTFPVPPLSGLWPASCPRLTCPTISGWAFSYCAPTLWNAIQQSLCLVPSLAPSRPISRRSSLNLQCLCSFTVKELVVSAGNNIVITLPKDEMELNIFVVPAPSAESPYKYQWDLISHPEDYKGVMEGKYTETLKLTQLSEGLYVFRVAVVGDNAYGESFVNVTVEPAPRVNQPPVAIASPKAQDVFLPTTSIFIDGSESTDDDRIADYRWEEIKGPLRDQKASANVPILHISNLVLGNYTLRLTVTDSDGVENSTTATVTVIKPVDYPPVVNPGPNQAITLPHNSITLNGNQSSDDFQIVDYEWLLSPNSNGKVVAMQKVRTPYLQLSAMQEGDYTFQLTLTDSAGQKSSAEVTVIVQPEINSPPVAVVGPDKELIRPVESTTLNGTGSTDDQAIVLYHWEQISGPGATRIENSDKALATVTGLQGGRYQFRLTVTDQHGLSSSSTVTVAVREETNSPPVSNAGGNHILVLPNSSIALDGSKSTDDQGIESYLWTRGGLSPAAGDVMYGSDREAVLQLTNLVEGKYIFYLKVTDAKGESDIDSTTVEVRPDPREEELVELVLQVGIGSLSEKQKDTLVRQLAVLLGVLDSDVKVQKIQAHSDSSTVLTFYVQGGEPYRVYKGVDVVRSLQKRLMREKVDFLLFRPLRIDTVVCFLKCSGHGYCDPFSKRCICYPFWMENLMRRYFDNGESNCGEHSSGWVTDLTVSDLCLCLIYRKRTKVRKKNRYTILDNMDDQERMALRPKYGLKHKSTEHNSSLMISESEFDSDQNTLFSRDTVEKGGQKAANGSLKNGVSFSSHPKNR
uniref:KIAA0319 n=1 Tax=Callorhinchus milii TaxID=7868 RepID=A0A4W3HSH4_CALMI